MLNGLLLVCSGDFGERLPFVFPPEELRTPFGLHRAALVKLLCPKPALRDVAFRLHIDNSLFVGWPTSFCYGDGAGVSMFNIVFVTDDHQDFSKLCEASRHLAAILSYEQRRCGYLSSQARILIDLMSQLDADVGRHVSETLSQSSLGATLIDVHSFPCTLTLKAYTGLSTAAFATLSVNNWISTSISLRPAPDLPSIFSYHTLLLIDPDDATALPPDSSPDLIRLIQRADPFKVSPCSSPSPSHSHSPNSKRTSKFPSPASTTSHGTLSNGGRLE